MITNIFKATTRILHAHTTRTYKYYKSFTQTFKYILIAHIYIYLDVEIIFIMTVQGNNCFKFLYNIMILSIFFVSIFISTCTCRYNHKISMDGSSSVNNYLICVVFVFVDQELFNLFSKVTCAS